MKHSPTPREGKTPQNKTGSTPASRRTVRTPGSLRQLERGGCNVKDERFATRSWPARKARRDTPHVDTPACDGTRTPRGPHMLLQHTELRGGSTWAASAWTCVAGHNIAPIGRSDQTSAVRFNTPHKHASASQHQHASRMNKAERSGCSTHSSQAEEGQGSWTRSDCHQGWGAVVFQCGGTPVR